MEFPEKYGADVIGHIRRGLEILAVRLEAALLALPRLRGQAKNAMEDIDALVLPATASSRPRSAPANEVREPLSRFTRPFNTTGQPVVTLPAPAPGLPVGIQVVGRTNAERWRSPLGSRVSGDRRHESKDFFPAVFSRHAEAYQRRLENIMARGEAPGRARVIELARARPGMRVLDLACGPGNLSQRLAAQVAPGGEVIGVDLAPA